MKKNKASCFVGIAFLCIIVFFFSSVCYRVYRVKRYFDYGISGQQSETFGTAAVDYKWPEKYPFSENEKFVYENDSSKEEKNETQSEYKSTYLTATDKIKDSVEYYATKLLPGRMKYIETNAWFNKIVGMKVVSGTDSVVVMKNGYLTFENNSVVSGDYASKSIKWFSDELSERGIGFAYIQYPAKEKKDDVQLPDGIVDNSNKNADRLLNKLNNEGVKCVDLRESLAKKSDDWYSNFFVTDHHWKPETGLWASGQIIDLLNSDFSLSLERKKVNINRYKIDVYEKINFGSQGKVSTLSFADPEDFSLIYPKEKTSITVQYNTDPEMTGRFEDVLFNKENLNDKDYYNFSAYSTYLNGNKAITKILNNDCKNGKKIIVIGDSYNKCVVPYLSQAVETVELIDRRYFDGSLMNYIDKEKPEIVLVAYTPTILSDNQSHSSTFNFE